ncbi:MAG: hypothetical protein ACI88A_000017 [Paraglaciecola sp.]|jgi:hypothetical protein
MVNVDIAGQVGLLTRHKKEVVIAPLLRQAFNWQVITTTDFDTDQLGTFSGEIPRTLNPLACAEQKARLACELTGLSLGLGSEGSFDAGPYGGFIPWNQELLTLVDVENGWRATGIAHGPFGHRHRVVQSEQQLLKFVHELPESQAVILYPQSRPGDIVFKGLLGETVILDAFRQSRAHYNEEVMVEFDLRAMHCPERRNRIAQATENLVARWQCRCPSCQRPGFWPDRVIDGLPCQACQLPTNAVAKRIAECEGCQHQQIFPVEKQFSDPTHCPYCNP